MYDSHFRHFFVKFGPRVRHRLRKNIDTKDLQRSATQNSFWTNKPLSRCVICVCIRLTSKCQNMVLHSRHGIRRGSHLTLAPSPSYQLSERATYASSDSLSREDMLRISQVFARVQTSALGCQSARLREGASLYCIPLRRPLKGPFLLLSVHIHPVCRRD